MTRVALAGATGWAGSALARGIARQADLALVAAVARRAAGRTLGEAIGAPGLTTPVFASAREALLATMETSKPIGAAELEAGLLQPRRVAEGDHPLERFDPLAGLTREVQRDAGIRVLERREQHIAHRVDAASRQLWREPA